MLVISVAVCTFNRSDLLSRCLDSLCSQTLDQSMFEILVVDNNSTDGTSDLVTHYMNAAYNVRYVLEPNQGLSHARNRGWKEAMGEYVGFFDDDSIAPKQWLSIALQVIKGQRPDIFGGPYYAYHLYSRPAWFKDEYCSKVPANESRYLEQGEWLSGTNIFFKRELLHDLGGFDTNLGMTGKKVAFGEETSLIKSAWRNYPDLKIYNELDLYVFHLVREQNMNLWSRARRQFQSGRFTYLSVFHDHPRHFALIPFLILRLAIVALILPADLTAGVIIRNRSKYPYPQNYIYEHCLGIIRRLGRYWEELITALKLRNR